MTHILIVSARFYEAISDELEAGAKEALYDAGATHELVTVSGALEIPPAIALAIDSGHYDGYVALGCVIRGETSHYDTVAQESARGLMHLGITHRAAIGNGVLTVENEAQAWVRAKRSEANKGNGAAQASLQLIAIAQKMEPKT